jgi:hypothetical protein
MAQEQPEQFNMKDLFIDVKLEACVDGSSFDFLGRKLFSTEFFRKDIGFGIVSIDIEVNTSLQPLVSIVFKDLYGATIFGGQERSNPNGDKQSIDYSVLFNWPPPKFLFSFKGYLGKPASWVLNLKKTSTSFNSSDGSYDLKCEFVPNQWGFFADLPFLYLIAAKRLRKDKLGVNSGIEPTSVFDLIKIGKQVEVKTQDTTKEFDGLVTQLGSIKSNISRALTVSRKIGFGDEIDGLVNNRQIKNFVKMKMPDLKSLDSKYNTKEKVEQNIANAGSLSDMNTYMLLSIGFEHQAGSGNFQNAFSKFPVTEEQALSKDAQNNPEVTSAKNQTLQFITKNLELINDEVRRLVFSTSEKKLEKITIGEIFSQLAKDAAFIIGSILDAGLDGYRGDAARRELRDSISDRLIGQAFPLVIDKDGNEVPAVSENLGQEIGVEDHEMDFVRRFISAISEGISKDLLRGGSDFGQNDNILKQRINNMEMSSENPYKSYYTNIATNVLVRAGIVSHFTRSNDPNYPGDYDILRGTDRDDIQSMEQIAERDMQNLTPNILKNLSDVDFLLIKRFAKFFVNFFTKNGDISDYFGESVGSPLFLKFQNNGGLDAVINRDVVLKDTGPRFENNLLGRETVEVLIETGELKTEKFSTIWNELYQPSILQGYEVVDGELNLSEIEVSETSRNEIDLDSDSSENSITSLANYANNILSSSFTEKNAQNPLSFVDNDFTATRIINNSIAYQYPNPSKNWNNKFVVFFRGDNHKKALEANSAPTDAELKNSDRKDSPDTIGQSTILGYAAINSKYSEKEGEEGEKLGRVIALEEFRDGVIGAVGIATSIGSTLTTAVTGFLVSPPVVVTSEGGNVYDFDKCKSPSRVFYGIGSSADGDAGESLLWRNSLLQDAFDVDDKNPPSKNADYAGDVGYTICSHLASDGDGLIFNLFGSSLESRNHRVYIRKCSEIIISKIKEIEDEINNILGSVLGKAGEQEDSIYKQMHTLYHQWQALSYSGNKIKGGSLCGDVDENKDGEGGKLGKVFNIANALEKKYGSNHTNMFNNESVEITQEDGTKESLSLSNSTESNGVPDGTFIYDFPLQRIRGSEEGGAVQVRDSIINLEPLYKANGNTSVLNIIQQVCTKNNFLFVPIPGNPDYLNVKSIYSPFPEPANLDIKNFFHVLFTPTPESRAKTRNHDGTSLALNKNHETYNANSFVIKYGHPDNQIVSNIQVGTDDTKVTAESIVNLQRLVDNENQNKKVTTDCSMLPVLAGRSYKASIDMLGNAQVYPMQFFFLKNSPLFGGLYQVMKVKHNITPNDFKTSVDGIRMRFSPGDGYGSIKPVTLQTFRDLGQAEAPLAISPGFDDAERESFKNAEIQQASSTRVVAGNANLVKDFSQAQIKEGNKGGPIALRVDELSREAILSLYPSAGLREFWVPDGKRGTKKLPNKQECFIIDGHFLPIKTFSAYKSIKEAAARDGINLSMNSGFRDPFVDFTNPEISSQLKLRRRNKKGNYSESQLGNAIIPNYDESKVLDAGSFYPVTAIPGRSAHNSGVAVDFNTGSLTGAIQTKLDKDIYSWMILNAWKFGFIRTVSNRGGKGEEWHWEYRPGEAMFSKCYRDDTLWYGLPDKLGVPVK